jgi:ribosomal protein L40E
MLLYSVFYDKHKVIIWAYAFPWIPYTRNLIIHYRHKKTEQICAECGERSSPNANFCPGCGVKLSVTGT